LVGVPVACVLYVLCQTMVGEAVGPGIYLMSMSGCKGECNGNSRGTLHVQHNVPEVRMQKMIVYSASQKAGSCVNVCV
jgi:hypothetical protein